MYASLTIVTWYGHLNEAIDNEQWGVDTISIRTVTETRGNLFIWLY